MNALRDFLGQTERWQKRQRTMAQAYGRPARDTRLQEIIGFGTNPGNLRMFGYRPPTCREDPALVVVLHGCTQTAEGYGLGAGWPTLAERHGFALLLPEQQRANNPNGCFNWFLPGDSRRNQGEPLSIRQMIEKFVIDHRIDRRRIFVTGLSAGGAMTSIMLACYPEVFAGGAIIAGLPYGAASNMQEAFQSMHQSPTRSAAEWGDLVRRASSYNGAWPRVSVWHGNADTTVVPSNAVEILKQWTDVHGLRLAASVKTRSDGFPREVWINGAGEEIIEAYTIPDMSHGTPLAVGEIEGACGVPGPFLLPVGISSSYHIAKFFGIAAAADAAKRRPWQTDIHLSEERVLEGEVLGKDEEPPSQQGPTPHVRTIGETIKSALRAAGLMQ